MPKKFRREQRKKERELAAINNNNIILSNIFNTNEDNNNENNINSNDNEDNRDGSDENDENNNDKDIDGENNNGNITNSNNNGNNNIINNNITNNNIINGNRNNNIISNKNNKKKNNNSIIEITNKIIISPGLDKIIEYDVSKNSMVSWIFNVEKGDIGFSLIFIYENGNRKIIINMVKCISSIYLSVNSWKSNDNGKILIVFDNTYSWFNPKVVHYSITIDNNYNDLSTILETITTSIYSSSTTSLALATSTSSSSLSLLSSSTASLSNSIKVIIGKYENEDRNIIEKILSNDLMKTRLIGKDKIEIDVNSSITKRKIKRQLSSLTFSLKDNKNDVNVLKNRIMNINDINNRWNNTSENNKNNSSENNNIINSSSSSSSGSSGSSNNTTNNNPNHHNHVDILYLEFPDNLKYDEMENILHDIQKLHEKLYFRELGIYKSPSWQISQIWHICNNNCWIKPTIYKMEYNFTSTLIVKEIIHAIRYYNIRLNILNPFGNELLLNDISNKFNISSKTIAIRWLLNYSELNGSKSDGIIIDISNEMTIDDILEYFTNQTLPHEIVNFVNSLPRN